MKKMLFASGSIGLGHVMRDIAIARELRKIAAVDIAWLAAPPADVVLESAGETLHPASARLLDMSAIAEAESADGALNIIRYALRARSGWTGNFELADEIVRGDGFDILVGDETYEIALGYKKHPDRKRRPFVMIYDFVGVDAMSRNPIEKLGAYLWNRRWAARPSDGRAYVDLGVFVGEEEDVPDASFGPFLPNRREWAKSRCVFVGYVFDFDPARLPDVATLRTELGYGASPLVICAVGGTSIGRELLELCGEAYPTLKEKIPSLQMVLVCGPRLDPGAIKAPRGVRTAGYVPLLHRHLAACDFAVVQGGGTVTLELTALRRPFAFFPIEGHCEQEGSVADRLARHGAGLRLRRSETSPARLAEVILDGMRRPAEWPPIRSDGARAAAEAIGKLL